MATLVDCLYDREWSWERRQRFESGIRPRDSQEQGTEILPGVDNPAGEGEEEREEGNLRRGEKNDGEKT